MLLLYLYIPSSQEMLLYLAAFARTYRSSPGLSAQDTPPQTIKPTQARLIPARLFLLKPTPCIGVQMKLLEFSNGGQEKQYLFLAFSYSSQMTTRLHEE